MMLAKQRVVIIGGSSGIGLATAAASLAEGAEVVIASRSQTKLTRAQESLGANVTTYQLDISDTSTIDHFFKCVGSFDHLQLPGSQSQTGPFLTLDSEVARSTFASKFWGAYELIKLAVPYVSKEGSITLYSGRLSQRPTGAGSAVLGAVNSAIEGLTRGLAVELAPIRVNCLAPGLTNTELFVDMADDKKQEFFTKAVNDFVIKRPAEPSEIAHGAVYLMTNKFTTGSTLFIDGGFTFK